MVTFSGTELTTCVFSGFIITNGKANSGAGIRGNSTHATIPNNVITANSTTDYGSGGGPYDCDGIILNNTIYSNSANQYGGGLDSCNGPIHNCIIWQNTAPTGPQLFNCSNPTYSCIQDWTVGGTGNITSNPLLANPAVGDFHLTVNSPCIDAGGSVMVNLTVDFEGDPRPFDGTSQPRGDGSDYDIGADEYYISPSSVGEWHIY